MKTIKIKEAQIFGFGKWINFTMNFSLNSLNCIYGFNESGKSTLQQFILFMFFGFSPKKRQFYRPKTSGKMGGRLIVIDDTYGTYTIERMDDVKNGAATCYLSDGKIKDELWLKARLHGIKSSSYEAIYLFSALELQEIKTMKNTDIGDVLFGVGLTGAHNIYEIEKNLAQNLDTLFKPNGTKPLINEQINIVEKTHKALINSQKQQATYREKYIYTEEIESELDSLQSKLKEERSLFHNIEKQLDMFPVIMDYHQILIKQSEFTNDFTFPVNGIARLEKLKEQLLPLQSECTVLQKNLQNNKQTYENLNEKQIDSKRLEKIETVYFQMQDYENNKQTYEKWVGEKKELGVALNTEMTHFNLNLNSQQLLNLSLPFYVEKDWQDIGKEITQISYEREQNLQDHAKNKHQKDTLLHESRELKQQMLPKDDENTLHETIRTYEENEMARKMRQQIERNEEKLLHQVTKRKKRQLTILVSSVLLSVLAGLLGWFLEESYLYIVMIIIGITGAVQWLSENQLIQSIARHHTGEQKDDHALVPISIDDYYKAKIKLRDNEQHVSDLREIEMQLKTSHIHQLQESEKNKIIDQRTQRLEERIHTETEKYPFLKGIDAHYWADIFHPLKKMISLQEDIQILSGKLASIMIKITDFETGLNKAVTDMDNQAKGNSVIKNIEQLKEIYIEQEQILQQKTHIDKMSQDILEKQKVIQHKIIVYQDEQQKLFKVANVESEDAFYHLGNQKQVYEENQNTLKQIKMQLKTTLPDYLYQQIITYLPIENDLKTSYQRHRKSIQELEQFIEHKRQKLADAKASLKHLESSESYSELNHRYNLEKERLQQLAEEWSIQKVAQQMLHKAKKTYQEKYLTSAIDRTIEHFKYVTNNNYIAIYPPTEKQSFQVERKDHTRFSVNELSQGTIDLLYISLRLAIGEIMSENSLLPFIIDDAFVHFDPERTLKMVHILKRISENRQIILFTCKQEISKALSQENIYQLNEANI